MVQAAQWVGVNYRNLYEAALHHKEALPAFLALAAGDFLDGAATDGYCTDLMTMLVQHGDKVFAQVARNFAPPVRCTILDFLFSARCR